ncbi:D-glycero-beta-D-manno-heptose-7-phosphate kinase [Candidatus Sumerlaeota bacterium]|nr:D-glycero-beta-D-manno-heptose-7-phosphate kinase [Candidatus Sumerlaeota bacterium]
MSDPRPTLQAPTISLDDLLTSDLARFKDKSVLVAGDLVLDHYLWGSVERTSPEAPVPVVHHEHDSWVLGGAANVANNIATLGGQVHLVGVVGKDEFGERWRSHCESVGVATSGVLSVAGRPTMVKTRVVSRGQILLRIDREDTSSLPEPTRKKLADLVRKLVRSTGAVVLSDYQKNTLCPEVVAAAIEAARERGIPVLVDPKGKDYSRYRGADILTPNLRELSLAIGRNVSSEAELQAAGDELIALCDLQALVVTLDAEGLALMRPGQKVHRIPAHAPEVRDETGAGDTTIATLGLGLAAGLSLEEASVLANQAGGIVVGKLGVATILPHEIKAALRGQTASSKVRSVDNLKILLANQQTRGRKVVFTNGCFDLLHPGHILFLNEARKLGDLLVVGLNTDRSVRALKGPPRPILPEDERAAILSALEAVDYIVFYDELTPETVLMQLQPDILVKGGNIAEADIAGREIVRSYGGRVMCLPALHPTTVTDLVDSILGKFEKTREPKSETPSEP